jgi:hypothetical protein
VTNNQRSGIVEPNHTEIPSGPKLGYLSRSNRLYIETPIALAAGADIAGRANLNWSAAAAMQWRAITANFGCHY